MDQIRGLLQQYVENDGAPASAGAPETVKNHFDQVAQAAPPDQLATGIASAIRSNQTPPFGEIASQLFGQSNGQQRAGLLNHLLGAVGPVVVSQVLNQYGGGQLASLIGGGQNQVSPQQASQVPPQAVAPIAIQAEQQDPSIIDRVSQLYAQHPGVVRGLGGDVLGMIMSQMGRNQNQ